MNLSRSLYLVCEEITLKSGGEIWCIHKGDRDPFPSSPHAHNVETKEKLDLSNGLLYRRREPTGHWLRKADLIRLRQRFEQEGWQMPALKI